MLWELLFFLRKSLQFYQMLYIIYLLFTDGFPSGQRGQTVNLLAPPSKVRILLHPANLALTSLRCRSYFFVQKENRKGAAKPRPLCTPLGLFLSSARDSLFLFVDLCLYASVFSALRCADVVLFLHFLCDSLPARCLYSSVLSAPRCADVVLFLHFLCGSLSARCLYSSILSALCVAISRFESQPASPRRPFTNRSTTATTTTQPSSAAPMAQNLPSSHPNLSQPNNQPGSHPKPQHHNIHTIRYNSKTSSV